MNNKVTYALFKSFASMGCISTMRFNFRGIGNSEGSFSDGEDELADAAAVMDWLQEQNRNVPFFLACRIFFWRVDWHAALNATSRHYLVLFPLRLLQISLILDFLLLALFQD